jgi:hypothetical protein
VTLILVSILVGTCALSSAQQRGHIPPPPVGGITFAQVIRLSQAGLSDETIIAQIKIRPQPFNLSPDQLLQLKDAQVSDSVIEAMATLKATVADDYPNETGVYWKDHGKWTEVLPEVVTLKTGGVTKNAFSIGVVKGDLNGWVDGGHSLYSVVAPCEFLIVLPEGTAITEYQLLQLHQHSESREFRTITGGVFHASTGAIRDRLQLAAKKVAPHTYLTTFNSNSGAGEYGFMPPGAYASSNVTSQGKLYSFRTYQ